MKDFEKLKGKKILITGGTGSFGKTVMSSFLQEDIEELRIFSRDEKKQDDLRKIHNHPKLSFILGDIRNYDAVYQATKDIDLIFHAAALKQVPSCEFFPMEAVMTNINGTNNLLNSAEANNVKKVVVLSTDKAVYPINVMGMTKAVAEKVATSRQMNGNTKTTICCTRYGNVMASRGSVIPLFVNQIKSKSDITITDPDMTRFIMSLEEAVNLVLYAFSEGTAGDTFVQKSPACSVKLLAEVLLDIFDASSDIRIIGTRHGEKLYETLVSKEEMARSEDLGNFFRFRSDNRDLNYDKYFVDGQNINPSQVEEYNSHNTHQLSHDELKEILLENEFIKKELSELWK